MRGLLRKERVMESVQRGVFRESQWVVGHQPEAGHLGPRFSDSSRVKWGEHQKGENSDGGEGEPTQWKQSSGNETVILISGSFTIYFRWPGGSESQEHTLSEQGAWVLLPDGYEHKWRVAEDTLTVTVGWR
jgi:hypothetical protein